MKMSSNSKQSDISNLFIRLSIILVVIVSALIMSVNDGYADSYELTDEQTGIVWKFTDYRDGYLLSGCKNIPENGVLDIPSSFNETAVVAIGYKAFIDDTKIKEVNIPDSVTVILASAFEGCTSLKSIRLSENITGIGDWLNGCTALNEILIPNKVESISNNAFRGCSSLESITIPASVKSFSGSGTLFWGCRKLREIKVDSENTLFKDIDGVLFTKNASTLIRYPEGKPDKHYILPEAVDRISEAAFMYSQVKTIDLGEKIKEIPDYCFYGSSNLEKIDVPAGVVRICSYAFFNDRALTSVKLPDGLKSIGEDAFGFTSFTEIDIPDSVETIETGAFSDTRLISVDLPAKLKRVEDYLFGGSAVRSVSIPESVTEIGRNPFRYSQSLEYVYVPASVVKIDGTTDTDILFSKTSTQLTVYGGNTYIQNYIQNYIQVNNITINLVVNGTIEDYRKAVEENVTGGNQTGGNTGDTPVDTGNDEPQGSGGSDTGDTPVDQSDPGGDNNDQQQSGGDAQEEKTPDSGAKTSGTNKVSLARPKLTAKNKKGRKIKLSWKKVKGADGYMIYVKGPKDKKFICRLKKSARVKSVTHKGLKKGKKYRYKIVAYKKVNGKILKSKASKTKTVKVKR